MAVNPRGNWTAGDVAKFAISKRLLADEIGDGSDRSKATKMGVILGRYRAEPFDVGTGENRQQATLEREDDRNGSVYRVDISDSAEPSTGNAES